MPFTRVNDLYLNLENELGKCQLGTKIQLKSIKIEKDTKTSCAKKKEKKEKKEW